MMAMTVGKIEQLTHTPGPWRWETRHPDIAVWAGHDANDLADEHVASVYGDGSEENAEANARLIAAAPELLAACRFALETFKGANQDERAVFLAAIAKAERIDEPSSV